MQFDKVADDGETQTEAAVLARRGAVALPEAFKDVRQKIGRDACAVVRDDDLDLSVDARELHCDAPAIGRELDRVRE